MSKNQAYCRVTTIFGKVEKLLANKVEVSNCMMFAVAKLGGNMRCVKNKIKGENMNLTKSLLYLLLLYAVLDKDNRRLSLTTGLTIAFVIMLLNCYIKNLGCNTPRNGWNNNGNNCCCDSFLGLNGI